MTISIDKYLLKASEVIKEPLRTLNTNVLRQLTVLVTNPQLLKIWNLPMKTTPERTLDQGDQTNPPPPPHRNTPNQGLLRNPPPLPRPRQISSAHPCEDPSDFSLLHNENREKLKI